jgi:hypothetical protein
MSETKSKDRSRTRNKHSDSKSKKKKIAPQERVDVNKRNTANLMKPY